MLQQAFRPRRGSNQVATPGAASAALTISALDDQCRVVNAGANVVHVVTYRQADGAVAATTAEYAVAAGMASIITKGEHDRIAHISALGTTIHVSTGNGF